MADESAWTAHQVSGYLTLQSDLPEHCIFNGSDGRQIMDINLTERTITIAEDVDLNAAAREFLDIIRRML